MKMWQQQQFVFVGCFGFVTVVCGVVESTRVENWINLLDHLQAKTQNCSTRGRGLVLKCGIIKLLSDPGLKPKDSLFTAINDKEQQQICTFKKLGAENV